MIKKLSNITFSKGPQERPHILVIDDDNKICKLVKQFLERHELIVSTATNVIEAKEYLKYFSFDLLIIDYMLPSTSGVEFAKEIRSSKCHIPMIMLTALSEIKYRLEGLEAGANDYIIKPFDPRELLLRSKKLIELYGYQRKEQNLINFGRNIFNTITKELTHNHEVVSLTASELHLLEMFLDNVSTALTREDIVKKMNVSELNERSVDVQIVRLRAKIEDDPKNPKHLKTVRNTGYIFHA